MATKTEQVTQYWWVAANEKNPIEIVRDLPYAKKYVEFVRISRGTVTGISKRGFDMILQPILRLNSHMKSYIHKFLSSNQLVPEAEVIANDSFDVQKLTRKITSTFQRVIRDSVVGKSLKNLYEYNCQVCGYTIETSSGKRYAEVHHLRPVGKPHNGKEGKPNAIVVCPQHHAMFDLGIIAVNPTTFKIEHWNHSAIEHGTSFNLKHKLEESNLRYHYTKIFKRTKYGQKLS
jgi:5-methylcytosine-specific restriction protein A